MMDSFHEYRELACHAKGCPWNVLIILLGTNYAAGHKCFKDV